MHNGCQTLRVSLKEKGFTHCSVKNDCTRRTAQERDPNSSVSAWSALALVSKLPSCSLSSLDSLSLSLRDPTKAAQEKQSKEGRASLSAEVWENVTREEHTKNSHTRNDKQHINHPNTSLTSCQAKHCHVGFSQGQRTCYLHIKHRFLISDLSSITHCQSVISSF